MKPAWMWLTVGVTPLGMAFAQTLTETVDQRIQACDQLPFAKSLRCLEAISRDLAIGPSSTQQAAPQDREKTEKPVRELTAELAQVKQQLQEERGKNEKLAGDMKAELAQLKQAAPRDREKTEKPVRELAAELAQVKQQLQEEHGRNEKLVGEVKTALAQLKQAAPQDREKTEKPVRELTAELAQVKQQLQEERGKNEKLVGDMKAERAQVKQQLQEERGKPKEPPAADVSRTGQGISTENATTITTSAMVGLPPGTAADSSDIARLLARARQFLSQGNVGMARMFLEAAVEKGSAPATFALAETYDPTVLAAWGTLGTQGDPAKARDLYQKALAGGVQDATDRLQSLDKEEIANPPRR